MAGADAKRLGRWGEERAAEYLRKKGYTILGMNYTCRRGEIDIIAKQGKFIAFVEVKLRKDARFAQAREFVTYSKQQRIMTAAMLWLSSHETRLQPRFDVVEVYAPQGTEGPVRIEHIEDAFQ